jgi:hypothetical protein
MMEVSPVANNYELPRVYRRLVKGQFSSPLSVNPQSAARVLVEMADVLEYPMEEVRQAIANVEAMRIHRIEVALGEITAMRLESFRRSSLGQLYSDISVMEIIIQKSLSWAEAVKYLDRNRTLFPMRSKVEKRRLEIVGEGEDEHVVLIEE